MKTFFGMVGRGVLTILVLFGLIGMPQVVVGLWPKEIFLALSCAVIWVLCLGLAVSLGVRLERGSVPSAKLLLKSGKFYKVLATPVLPSESDKNRQGLVVQNRDGKVYVCHFPDARALVIDRWYQVDDSIGVLSLSDLSGTDAERAAAVVLLGKGIRPTWL